MTRRNPKRSKDRSSCPGLDLDCGGVPLAVVQDRLQAARACPCSERSVTVCRLAQGTNRFYVVLLLRHLCNAVVGLFLIVSARYRECAVFLTIPCWRATDERTAPAILSTRAATSPCTGFAMAWTDSSYDAESSAFLSSMVCTRIVSSCWRVLASSRPLLMIPADSC